MATKETKKTTAKKSSAKVTTPKKEVVAKVEKEKVVEKKVEGPALKFIEGHPVLSEDVQGGLVRIRTTDGLGYTLPLAEYEDKLRKA